MRRIAGLAIGLILLAMGLSAQTPTISQTRGQRTVQSTSATVGDTTTLTYVVQDSFRTRVVQRYKPADSLALATLRKALADTAAALKVAKDSLAKWPKPCTCDSVPVPPKDSTPTPPPPPPPAPVDTSTPGASAVLFRSDFAGGVLDGGKWARWGDNGALASVSAAGLGFPAGMSNVLRVTMGTGTFDWVQASGKWSLPAIGGSRAFRVYFRNAVTATSGGWAATHPIESKGTDGSIAGNFYAWHVGAAGELALGTEAPWPRNYLSTSSTTNADVGRLPKNTTYRLEWKWTRANATDYRLDVAIYDAAGAKVEDRTTFKAWGGGTLASYGSAPFTLDDWAVTGLRLGINGGFAASGAQYVYWGGFAVCADWCGPYAAGR